ncbi:MAG: DUF5683 domain-containing protein [Nitrospirales bacterium]
MKSAGVGKMAFAATLSAVFPGLGQLYNGQRFKGVCFLGGGLVLVILLLSMLDPVALQQSAQSGVPPENFGRILVLTLALMGVLLWSILDAARVARRAGTG